MGAGSSTINVATSPTAAGHLLVIGVASDNGFSAITTVTSIADNAGNTWVSANALSQVTNQHWSSEMWYAANSQSGATTVTVTAPTASAGRLVWFMEVDGIANVAPLDVVVTSSDAAPTSNPKAPLVTPTVLPSLIVSVGNFQETLLGLQMPTMFVALPISSSNNTAYGVAVEPSSYGPVWNDTTSGAYSASTAAFRAR